MKRFLYVLLLLLCKQGICQNYIFTNTGNLHNEPYGIKEWDWDTAAYQHFSYTSPAADNYTMLYRMLTPPQNDSTQLYPLFIMLHGAGEGIGGDCDSILPPNTCQLVWGGQIALDSINKYPGYVFFPHQTGGNGYWGNNGDGNDYHGYDEQMSSHTRVVFEIIENILLKGYNIDPDRIYLAGLASGADAVWEFMERRPDLFAAVTPFEGAGNPYLAKTLINNPIWMYQGGNDNNPSPDETLNLYDSLTKYGGDPRRSLYEDRDSWSWVDAYQSSTWLQWLYRQNKKTIHVLYGGLPELCQNDSLNLGISDGFLQYQWSKDGEKITGDTAYVCTIKQPGTYQVTYTRVDGMQAMSDLLKVESVMCNPLAVEAPQVLSEPLVLVRILTLMGQAINESQAVDGIFIYQYNDGSTKKIIR
jgi:predicted esterase